MKAKILYIEDNQDNLRLVKRLLSMNDYHFIGETDAFEGIKRAEKELPDLILMDINLPGLSGYEATTRIRAIPSLRNTPIVAVTAGAMSGDRERALSVGCAGYISKPIDVDTFVPSIAAFIKGDKEEVSSDVKNRFLEEHNLRLVEQLESKIIELEAARDHLEEEVRTRTDELIVAHKQVLAMEKNTVVSEMSGAIAHELNQPLSILMGYCELLQSGQLNGDDSKNVTVKLIEQADRMAGLIKKLTVVTEYKTKRYSRRKIVSIEDGSLDDIDFNDFTFQDMPLVFMLKQRIQSVEQKLKEFESCALAGHMLKAVFHRLNNHFQAIRGYTDLLLVLPGREQEDKTCLTKLSAAIDGGIRLMSLFTELLSVSPNDESNDRLNVNLVCQKVVSLLRQLYRRIEIQYFCENENEDNDSLFVSMGHSELIRIILSFLVFTINRVSSCGENGFSVSLSSVKGFCRLCISDCCGISVAEFEEKEILGGSSSSVKPPIDTSLLIRSIDLRKSLAAAGGYFEMQKHGDRFDLSVFLPCVLADNEESNSTAGAEGDESVSVSSVAAVQSSGTGQVLIVDDEVSICEIMRHHLESHFEQIKIDTCHSAEDALVFLGENECNLLILDVNLPGKSGLDILPQIRSDYPDIVVIIITGLIADDDLEIARKQGVAACLRKPVKKKQLFETVSSVMPDFQLRLIRS